MSFNKSASPASDKELSRRLLRLILFRAVVFLLWLNLANRLSLLPERLGPLHFLPLFNILALSLSLLCLGLWRIGRQEKIQLGFQIGVDLLLTTILVAYTHGIESSFVSFYLLIIIYCSLMLGRNSGMVGAALSTILYAGIVIAVRSASSQSEAWKWILVRPHFEFQLMCLDFGRSPTWEHVCIKDCGALNAN